MSSRLAESPARSGAAIPALVPARMVNEVLYCERLFYLEWSQGEFADNAFTVDGRAVHRRADAGGGALPPKPGKRVAKADDESEVDVVDERPYQARSVWLSSEELGLTAKIDVVEGEGSGRVLPIEYKRGSAPDVPEGAYLPERAQVAAQVMLLRASGYACDVGALYFAGSKRRVPVEVDASLETVVLRAIARAREVAASAKLPPPLDASPKCKGCSLVGICLPDEVNLLRKLEGLPIADDVAPTAASSPAPLADEPDPWGLAPTDAPSEPEPIVRRLIPARDDALPLYVQDQGARVGVEGDRLVVHGREGGRHEARLPNTSHVVLLGNVQVSTQAVRALLEREIPIVYCTYGGWVMGRAEGFSSKNVELRMAQHEAMKSTAFRLRFARGIVAAKIRNGRTMVRRNHEAPNAVVLGELERLAREAEAAESPPSLLGIEGAAAKAYFAELPGMLKGTADVRSTFAFEHRNRRPPRDPINALLSFVYALLVKDVTLACAVAGLDPMLGAYHTLRFGRPSLALDLMEELRPIVADSVVIGVVNNGVLDAGDFIERAEGVALSPAARKKVILAYERRMDQLVTHPIFDYRISYRRIIEVQARLFSRLILGELDAYPSFRTR